MILAAPRVAVRAGVLAALVGVDAVPVPEPPVDIPALYEDGFECFMYVSNVIHSPAPGSVIGLHPSASVCIRLSFIRNSTDPTVRRSIRPSSGPIRFYLVRGRSQIRPVFDLGVVQIIRKRIHKVNGLYLVPSEIRYPATHLSEENRASVGLHG